MSSFLSGQPNKRSGKWTAEEEVYAACIIEAFKEGSLKDVEEGTSLRGYLAKKLRTNVKRISKKYEGTNYNGKRIYMEMPDIDKEVAAARQAKLQELELKFEKSVKLLEEAESAKKDMTRLDTRSSLLSTIPPQSFIPGAFPSSSLASSMSFVSRDALEENLQILARQSAVHSLGIRRAHLGGSVFGNALNHTGSFQSLMGCVPPPSLTRTVTPSLSSASLNRFLQQEHDAVTAEIARREIEMRMTEQLLSSTGAASLALVPPTASVKRPQLQSPYLTGQTNAKRAKLL